MAIPIDAEHKRTLGWLWEHLSQSRYTAEWYDRRGMLSAVGRQWLIKAKRGIRMSWRQYCRMGGNGYDRHSVIGMLDDTALIGLATYCLQQVPQFTGPKPTGYNELLLHTLTPELCRRLAEQARIDLNSVLGMEAMLDAIDGGEQSAAEPTPPLARRSGRR